MIYLPPLSSLKHNLNVFPPKKESYSNHEFAKWTYTILLKDTISFIRYSSNLEKLFPGISDSDISREFADIQRCIYFCFLPQVARGSLYHEQS